MSFGFARYGYGLFLPEMRREFGLSVATVGLIGSATYVGYLAALIVVAGSSARVGPKRLIGFGGVSAVIGMGLVAVAPNTGVLAAGLVLAGTSPAWAWAPYSDAVDQVVHASRRDFVLALIPAGTAVGTAIVGPLALVASGAAWRAAWLGMAAVAACVAVYNAWVLPGRGSRSSTGRGLVRRDLGGRDGGGTRAWVLRRAARPLYLTAMSYGALGAFYWYFATEALSRAAIDAARATAVFWTVMGLAGALGLFAGVMLARLGLCTSSKVLFLALSSAVALIGIAPDSLAASTASAVLYGPAFMAVSSLLAVWSYRVFPDRPTSGLSAALLALGAGTVIGPATFGALADTTDLRTAFLTVAAMGLATTLVRAPART
jgi:predicted MFS family arabinose efflux permease